MTPQRLDRLLDAIPTPFLYVGWLVVAALLIWLFGPAGAAVGFFLPFVVLGPLVVWEAAEKHWQKRRAGR